MPGPQPDAPDVFAEPPAVAITPCDPWPRPYYFKDGLRRVTPYHYTYNTNCKERWRGRELLEIFKDEFRDRPIEYYKDAIESGLIVLNGKPVTTTTRVKNGDIVSHTTHRHEPPVSAQPITIVSEDSSLIVISKPSGIPVHPAGRYHYNSIVEILRSSRGPEFNPLPCNRLDRLTSGIMFLAKHPEAAAEMTNQIMARTVKKEYVARVAGEFPEGRVVCEQPMMQISPKLGLNRVRADGKEARTVFVRLAYYPPKEDHKEVGDGHNDNAQAPTTPTDAKAKDNDDITNNDTPIGPQASPTPPVDPSKPWQQHRGYSIVRCLPLTGRTHQIRVHLQFLGHPITNDPIYCNQKVFGINLGRGDASASHDDDIMTRLSRMGKSEVADAIAYHDEMVDEYNKRKSEKMTGEVCEVCGTPLYSDPGLHELGIYLHALRYADEDGAWSYETPLPEWALPPKGYVGPSVPTKEMDPIVLQKMEELKLGRDGGEEVGQKLERMERKTEFVLGTHPG